jgi:methionyl-tRNA formyltransferase
LNIVFAGTPYFALPCLEAIAQSQHRLLAIYTQPDRPAGRGHKLQHSPVKEWALAHDLPVYQPLNFKNQATIDELTALQPDLMIVIAYGLILPRAVLDIPRLGCINVHASLLPRWRGASPIQQAILHQDAESGVTIMQMDAGMDTGAMLKTVSCPIGNKDTAGMLHDTLASLAATPLLTVLDLLEKGALIPTPQDNHLVTFAPKINKDDAAINWQKTANEIDCQIRAFNPWPIAYTHAKDETIRIHEATALDINTTKLPGTILAIDKEGVQIATGQHVLSIQRLQFSGGKALRVADWLNAHRSQLHVDQVLQ